MESDYYYYFIQSRQKRVVWYTFSSPCLAGSLARWLAVKILAFERLRLHYDKNGNNNFKMSSSVSVNGNEPIENM